MMRSERHAALYGRCRTRCKEANSKIAENSEICENYSLLFITFHYYSFVSLVVLRRAELAEQGRAEALQLLVRVRFYERVVLQRDADELHHSQLLEPMLGLTQLSNYLTLKGSFSAVSKPNFASKYALESSRRDRQNALLCTVL